MALFDHLIDAQPSFQDNRPVVTFSFDAVGARKFGKVTAENVGKPFAIILDGKVISAPVIRSAITGGGGIITIPEPVDCDGNPIDVPDAGAGDAGAGPRELRPVTE